MQDLLDTLMAHKDSCVGMAANMSGVKKRISAFLDKSGRVPVYTVMLNPEIIKKDGAYNTEEGCLSLLGGQRPCKRYKSIKVKYQTMEMQNRIKTYTSWTTQIIQHEIDPVSYTHLTLPAFGISVRILCDTCNSTLNVINYDCHSFDSPPFDIHVVAKPTSIIS